ncbi:MAG: adenosine deaminase [Pseudomonadota bacterium]
MHRIKDLVRALPKVELHLHIEGSLEPQHMLEFAARNGVQLPYCSVAEIKQAYQFNNLQEFLDIYYQGMSVLCTEQDFHDLTYAYMRRVHADNCRHVEIFFDPQAHKARGIAFGAVINGILSGLAAGERDFGITAHLIMSFMRHLSEASAFETLEQATPYLDRLLGVGLDSSELGHPPCKFKRVFAKCRDFGLKIFAHAGEEGPPEYIYQALDELCIDRLDHGNRALEDPALTKRLAQQGICLTVCPLSNVKLCVVDTMAQHPIRQMLAAGLRATVNSDDPSYFGGYINDNFTALADAVALTHSEVVQLSMNAVDGSFLPAARKAELFAEIKTIADASLNTW